MGILFEAAKTISKSAFITGKKKKDDKNDFSFHF